VLLGGLVRSLTVEGLGSGFVSFDTRLCKEKYSTDLAFVKGYSLVLLFTKQVLSMNTVRRLR
jgi:hypothetical protein